MGIVSRDCLKIDRLSIVKKILISYRVKRNHETLNWNELSKNILKMERI